MQFSELASIPGVTPNVGQAGDRAGGRVGVETGQHEMTGHRSLNRDACGLVVADLPDEEDVGSLRRIVRRPRANVSPALTSTSTWLTPSSWYSTGSSIVIATRSRSCRIESAAYNVVVLPLPVGPHTITAP